MRRAIALLVVTLLPVLGLAGVGLAQSAVEVQGTIQAVDCQNQIVGLSSSSGSNTVAITDSTAVLVNSASVPFCTLQQYVGAPATAWLVPNGNEFEVTRLDVTGPATASPPSAPQALASPSTLGIVVGAIAVAGLAYLIGRQSANQAPAAYEPLYPTNYRPAYQYGRGRSTSGYGNRYRQCGQGAWNQWNQSCTDSRGAPGGR